MLAPRLNVLDPARFISLSLPTQNRSDRPPEQQSAEERRGMELTHVRTYTHSRENDTHDASLVVLMASPNSECALLELCRQYAQGDCDDVLKHHRDMIESYLYAYIRVHRLFALCIRSIISTTEVFHSSFNCQTAVLCRCRTYFWLYIEFRRKRTLGLLSPVQEISSIKQGIN